MARKSKYSQKTVRFGGKEITLFSLDGITWSSRKEELEAIMERHEQEKASFGGQIKGGPQAVKPVPLRPALADGAALDEVVGEDASPGLDAGEREAEVVKPPADDDDLVEVSVDAGDDDDEDERPVRALKPKKADKRAPAKARAAAPAKAAVKAKRPEKKATAPKSAAKAAPKQRATQKHTARQTRSTKKRKVA